MGDAIDAAASGQVCYGDDMVSGDNSMASGDNKGETIEGGTNVCQGNFGQAGGWLDSVCEPEYYSLPPVCYADDEAQAADAAKARAVGRGETLQCPPNHEMPPCPSEWDGSDLPGWKKYGGVPSVFHCGFRGMVADCNPDSGHRQQECFYDEAGQLVKGVEGVKAGEYVHIDYRCAGSPNADDAMEHPIRHIFSKGGLLQSGWTSFFGTLLHADREQHEAETWTPIDEYGYPIYGNPVDKNGL